MKRAGRWVACVLLVRAPFFLMCLLALAVSGVVLWVYDRIPPEWIEEEDEP